MNNSFIPNLPNDDKDNKVSNEQPNLTNGSNKSDGDNLNFSDVNSFDNTSNEVNQNKVINPYRDYLPENRENNGISPKVMKFGLGMFWIAVICVACLISFKYLYGVDVFEVKSRNYNLNLAETINLDNIYSSDDVVWESDSDNVVIKNNVVFANKTGSAYILGRIGEQQVSDVKVNVLSADAALSLENHSVSLSVGESTQIKVNQIASTTNNGDNIQSSLSNSSITNGSNIKDEIDDDIVTDEYEEEDGSDTLINDDSMDDFDDYYDGDYVNDENDSSDSEKLGDIIIDDKLNNKTDNRSDNKDNSISIDNANDDTSNSSNDLEYKSSDEGIAKVDDKGNITPVSPGTVIITVKDKEGNKDHTYVTVEDDDLIFQNTNYTLNVDDNASIQYEIKGTQYKTTDVVWSSSNTNVCTVDSSGKIFGIAAGTSTITAKLGDKIEKNLTVKVVQNEVLPSSLSLSVSDLTLTIGENEKIVATVLPSAALNRTVSYVSKDSSIASVDSQGNVVGKGVGNTIIVASTANGIKKEVMVKVNKKTISVDKISFKESSINLEIDNTVKLNYSIEPTTASDKTVQFNYDKNMVSIDENGYLKALKVGKTKVEIVSSNGLKSTMSVNITPKSEIGVEKINLTTTTMNLEIGDTSKINYTISPSNAKNKKINYVYDNTIISVDSNGKVKALKEGKTTVSLKSDNGVVANFTVVVNQPKEVIKTLSIRDGNFKISVNSTRELSILVKGSNIQNSNIRSSMVWSSSNSNILEVDSKGIIHAKKAGNATVTVKLEDKSASINANVITPTVKVTSIKLNKDKTSVKMGGTEKLTVSIFPSNATNQNVTWKSSDVGVLKVNNKGMIKGISKGSATVTVYSNDNNKVLSKINVSVTAAATDSKLSNLENAKSYENIKVLKTITYDKLKDELEIEADSDFRIAQGFAVTNYHYVAAVIRCLGYKMTEYGKRCDGEETKIYFYNRKSKKLVNSFIENFGHANGLTSNTRTKMIYTTTPNYSFSYKNTVSLKSIKPVPMSWNSKAIAYDSVTNQYYLRYDKKVMIYDSNYKFIKSFNMIRFTNQDCAAYKGLFLCANYPGAKGAINRNLDGNIDIYRVSDAAYVGTINVNTMNARCNSTSQKYCGIELEGLDWLGGNKFALYYNYGNQYKNESKTGKRLAAVIYSTIEFPLS